jgi:hypothetical protein
MDQMKLVMNPPHKTTMRTGRFCHRSRRWCAIVREWKMARGLLADPLKALAEGGYVDAITRDQGSRNARHDSGYV